MIKMQSKLSKEKLNITPQELEAIKTLSSSLQQIIKSKADRDDLTKIQQEKTNKADTEHLMRSLETIHRMIENLSVL